MRSQPRGERRHDDLRCRRSITERGVRSHGVVMTSTALDHDLDLLKRVEDLTIEQLIA